MLVVVVVFLVVLPFVPPSIPSRCHILLFLSAVRVGFQREDFFRIQASVVSSVCATWHPSPRPLSSVDIPPRAGNARAAYVAGWWALVDWERANDTLRVREMAMASTTGVPLPPPSLPPPSLVACVRCELRDGCPVTPLDAPPPPPSAGPPPSAHPEPRPGSCPPHLYGAHRSAWTSRGRMRAIHGPKGQEAGITTPRGTRFYTPQHDCHRRYNSSFAVTIRRVNACIKTKSLSFRLK